MVSISEREAYIEGRLLGLEELITLLNEIISTEGVKYESLIKTLVMHIAKEMEEIIQHLQGVQETKKEIAPSKTKMDSILKKLRTKTKEMRERKFALPPEEVKEDVKSAEELIKDLAAIKKSTEEKSEEEESPEEELEKLVEEE